MGAGNKDFNGNYSVENGKSTFIGELFGRDHGEKMFAWEREEIPVLVKSFSHGNFAEGRPEFYTNFTTNAHLQCDMLFGMSMWRQQLAATSAVIYSVPRMYVELAATSAVLDV